jgi:hypothetical protein
VNYLELVSAASGELPQLKAFGSDADVGIKISPKGIGRLQLYGQRIEGLNYGGYLGFTVTLDSLGDLDYLHIAPGLVGGQAVNLHALGNDADININCIPQGTGRLQVAAIAVPTISSTDTLTNKTITRLILTAGSTTVAPLKLQSGSLLTTPAAGSMEFLTDTLSFTITTGAARKTIPFLETAQTWTAAQTLGTTTKILFTDANAFIHASASGALVLQGTTSTTVGVAGNIIVGGGGTGTIQIGSASTQLVGFYGTTPIVRPAACTTALTAITHTAPGTPDYAIQNVTNVTPFGFVTADEANTVLKVIAHLQAVVGELRARLGATTGVGLFAGA